MVQLYPGPPAFACLEELVNETPIFWVNTTRDPVFTLRRRAASRERQLSKTTVDELYFDSS